MSQQITEILDMKLEHLMFELHLESDAIAPFVWLTSGDIQGFFSDNGFLMSSVKTIVYFTSHDFISSQQLERQLTVKSFSDVQV
jgi:beta-mannosidase